MARKPNPVDDARQSPIGFFNLGLAYLDAADQLAVRHLNVDDPFSLSFEGPIRHLYAHTWELCLKACNFRQGLRPSEMRVRFSHSLTRSWDAVDKKRFAALRLHPDTRMLMEGLDRYHGTRWYAYPMTGYRREFTIPYVRAATQRFRIGRAEITSLFG